MPVQARLAAGLPASTLCRRRRLGQRVTVEPNWRPPRCPRLYAVPSTPYEPLEKAIRALNRVIALGERAGWGSPNSSDAGGVAGADAASSAPTAEARWVQFGAVYNSSTAVEQPSAESSSSTPSMPSSMAPNPPVYASAAASAASAAGAASVSGSGGRQLRDYLALPIEQYSLLDPKWISRWGWGCGGEGGGVWALGGSSCCCCCCCCCRDTAAAPPSCGLSCHHTWACLQPAPPPPSPPTDRPSLRCSPALPVVAGRRGGCSASACRCRSWWGWTCSQRCS